MSLIGVMRQGTENSQRLMGRRGYLTNISLVSEGRGFKPITIFTPMRPEFLGYKYTPIGGGWKAFPHKIHRCKQLPRELFHVV